MLYFLLAYSTTCGIGYWIANYLRYQELKYYNKVVSWKHYWATDPPAHWWLFVIYLVMCSLLFIVIAVCRHLGLLNS